LPSHEGEAYLKDKNAKHLTSEEFKEKFDATERAKEVRREINEPVPEEKGKPVVEISSKHFANPTFRSMRLLAAREMLLWWRDKYQIKARIAQGSCSGNVSLLRRTTSCIIVFSLGSRFLSVTLQI
jgi:hypothetical protein